MFVRRGIAVCALAALVAGCTAARAMQRGYHINTADLTCDDANLLVQQSLGDMNMRITDFRKARPGAAGYASAERDDGMSGSVDISCDAAGVHIIPDQSGFSSGREFERGLFLSIVGRADLVVEREDRYSTGVLHKRQHAQAATTGTANDATGGTPFAEPVERAMEVQVELVRGFATVLDFEANVSAAGILPVRITIANQTKRSYDFDPSNITLRHSETRDVVQPMSARATVDRLRGRSGGEGAESENGAEQSELGDLEAASRIIPDREIKKARLEPGQSVTGYVYFADGEYDRARVDMVDVATGETEAFLVEF